MLEKFVDPVADAGELRRTFDYGRDRLAEIVREDEARAAAEAPRPSLWKRLTGRR